MTDRGNFSPFDWLSLLGYVGFKFALLLTFGASYTWSSNLCTIDFLSSTLCIHRGHPERPDRIARIYEKHKDCGLLQRCKVLPVRSFLTDKYAYRIPNP